MSRLISQLRHNITKYNLLLWQLRGATGGGQPDFVLQDKSDFFSHLHSFFFCKYSYLDVHFNLAGGLKYHIFATQNLCVIQMFR